MDSIRDVALNIINVSPSPNAQGGGFSPSRTPTRGEVSSTSSAPTSNCRTKTGSRCSKRRGCWRARPQAARNTDPRPTAHRVEERDPGKVKQEIDKQQRDYYLQQQMRTIQDELGDGADADIDEMREAAKQKNWPKEVAKPSRRSCRNSSGGTPPWPNTRCR